MINLIYRLGRASLVFAAIALGTWSCEQPLHIRRMKVCGEPPQPYDVSATITGTVTQIGGNAWTGTVETIRTYYIDEHGHGYSKDGIWGEVGDEITALCHYERRAYYLCELETPHTGHDKK